ncbi:unnamed protein product [Diplocarpon coronariae]
MPKAEIRLTLAGASILMLGIVQAKTLNCFRIPAFAENGNIPHDRRDQRSEAFVSPQSIFEAGMGSVSASVGIYDKTKAWHLPVTETRSSRDPVPAKIRKATLIDDHPKATANAA